MLDVSSLKSAAAGRWPEILSQVGGIDAALLDGRKHPCPKCGGGDRFRFIDAEDGALFCNQCFNKGNGDGLAAIQWLRGCDFLTAKNFVADYLGANRSMTTQPPRIVATYDYRDENCELLFQVVRKEPKAFSQRKPKEGGAWEYKLGDVRRVLYRLPELLAADPQETVFICEGEKDCDNLARLGLVATTNAGGAGKWQPEFTETLRGRHIVILPDNDQPGEAHAELVAGQLKGLAASVKVVRLPELPEKGDVSDWLAAGGDAAQLAELVSAAAEWAPADPGAMLDDEEASDDASPVDPGPLPQRLLSVPGFVGKVAEYMEATAPYPSPVLSFSAAISTQSLFASRKVRDSADNRPNVYLLALAPPGTGKDHGRKISQRILTAAGLGDCIGADIASAEGLEDALQRRPAYLVQLDEVAGLLNAIKGAYDPRYEAIMNLLLRLYSESSGIHPIRLKARQEPAFIDQPGLVLYGTTTPGEFAAAISQRLLANGLTARTLVVDARHPRIGREPQIQELPEDIVSVARWWAEFRPGSGNLSDIHPTPRIVELTPEALTTFRQFRERLDAEYNEAQQRGDEVAMAQLARGHENARRLALIYAVSENHENPLIGNSAAQWACDLVEHLIRDMLFRAATQVAENDFDGKCNKLLNAVRQWQASKGGPIPQRDLARKLRWTPRDFREVVESLTLRQQLTTSQEATGGRPRQVYSLAI